jgi:hypothetical protein
MRAGKFTRFDDDVWSMSERFYLPVGMDLNAWSALIRLSFHFYNPLKEMNYEPGTI